MCFGRLVRHQKLLKIKDNKSIASTSHFKLVIIMYPYNDPGEGEGKQSWTEGSEAKLLLLDTR